MPVSHRAPLTPHRFSVILRSQLSLDFGESTHMYPMSNVSNGQFERSELVAWEQVLVAASRELVTESRARVRATLLERDAAAAEQSAQQNVHEPGPAAVDPRANAPPAQLSTRQRMAASATRTEKNDGKVGARDFSFLVTEDEQEEGP